MNCSTHYAILRPQECAGDDFQHNVNYDYMYNEQDVFYILKNGTWHEAPSTAFDFIEK